MRFKQLSKRSRVNCFADMARQCVPRRRAGITEGPLTELGSCPRCTEKSEDDGRRPERDCVAG